MKTKFDENQKFNGRKIRDDKLQTIFIIVDLASFFYVI